MPITTMTGAENAHLPNVRKVSDYPGHEEGLIRHGSLCCRHGSPRDTSGEFSPFCALPGSLLPGESEVLSYGQGTCDGPFRALYMKTEYVGLVVATGEKNGYDDSDFYAVVWDAAAGRPREVVYASTRGWTYPNTAAVDSTPEVRAAYNAYTAAARAAAKAAREAAEQAAAEKAARTPQKGDRAVVIGGRTLKKGTEVMVLWTGMGNYGKLRTLVATSDDRDDRGRFVDTKYIDLRWLLKVEEALASG